MDQETSRLGRLALRLAPFLAAGAAFLAFLPALRNGFVSWDDPDTILRNEHFRGLAWSNLRWMFTSTQMGNYQPLSWLTLALDYKLWGLEPFGYHLTNLLLHCG
ncbi:MAG: hypothetical protein WC881_09555, partial [Elusimicrobiota bacterium]